MERECVNCGNKEQKIIKNGTHLHEYRLSSVIEATCESTGSKIYSCTCEESYSETLVVTKAKLESFGIITSDLEMK